MSARQVVSTSNAPAAIGPYSQAIAAGGFVFTAGQVGLDPTTGALVGAGDVARETEQALTNLQAVLRAAGTDLTRAVRCDVFLLDLGDFATMNRVYASHFGAHPPARVTVQAARLPKDARVEIAVIAALGA